jgi:polyhydroxybutyrate depolymerase
MRISANIGRAALLGACITAASCAGPTDAGNGGSGVSSGGGTGSPSSGNSSNSGVSTGNSSGSAAVGSGLAGGGASSGEVPGPDAAGGEGGSSGTNVPGDATDDGASSNDSAPLSEGGMLPGAMPSPGCGMAAGQALQTFVPKQTMPGNRTYRVWLPAAYDPKRPYRTVFLGHGCGGNGGLVFPGLDKIVDAVLVELVAVGSCFDNGNGTTNSPELVYFDEVSKEVAANFCVDQARSFIAGFSSGSWLSHLVGCARAGTGAGKIRGEITASGEWPNPPPCTGPVAAMLAHNNPDDQNPFPAGMVARDHILQANKCTATTVPYSYDGVTPATATSGGCAVKTAGCQPCVEYQGCTPGYPMVWCPTVGSTPLHNNQEPITTVGLWKFIQRF